MDAATNVYDLIELHDTLVGKVYSQEDIGELIDLLNSRVVEGELRACSVNVTGSDMTVYFKFDGENQVHSVRGSLEIIKSPSIAETEEDPIINGRLEGFIGGVDQHDKPIAALMIRIEAEAVDGSEIEDVFVVKPMGRGGISDPEHDFGCLLREWHQAIFSGLEDAGIRASLGHFTDWILQLDITSESLTDIEIELQKTLGHNIRLLSDQQLLALEHYIKLVVFGIAERIEVTAQSYITCYPKRLSTNSVAFPKTENLSLVGVRILPSVDDIEKGDGVGDYVLYFGTLPQIGHEEVEKVSREEPHVARYARWYQFSLANAEWS